MTDTINGRTPEEIYKALRCLIVQMNDDCEDVCSRCEDCPYNVNGGRLGLAARLADTIVRIQQLERERDEARGDLDTLNYAVTELHSAYDAMKRERDAAVADMTELMQLAQFCRHCKHLMDDGECTFDFAANKDEPWCWQWRGVQEVE